MQEYIAAEIWKEIAETDSAEELLQLAAKQWADGNWLMAAKCYHKAAKLGSADGQNLLGECYEIGMGVQQSDAYAVRWYIRAAAQRHGKAMCSLADYYYHGIVVKRNEALAEALLLLSTDEERAAEKLQDWFEVEPGQTEGFAYHNSLQEAEQIMQRFIEIYRGK